MPELPEVETICRILRDGRDGLPSLVGKNIIDAEILWEGCIASPTPSEFQTLIRGEVIREIGRRGKYIRFLLSKYELIFHLRMSGDIFLEAQDQESTRHVRLLLNLDNGWRLSFYNPRKFGRVWLLGDTQEFFSHLGLEPLDEDFSAKRLYMMLQSHRRQLKPLLMDQAFLAGMGNIYTDEALFIAKLHPLTRSDAINEFEARRLWSAIRKVLLDGIRSNGSSIDWAYRRGGFQNYFQVYQRTGEPCYTCGTPIKRIVVAQRGTHFCPHCQLPPDDNFS